MTHISCLGLGPKHVSPNVISYDGWLEDSKDRLMAVRIYQVSAPGHLLGHTGDRLTLEYGEQMRLAALASSA